MKKRLGLLLAVSAMALGLGGAFAMSTVNGGVNKVEEASAVGSSDSCLPTADGNLIYYAYRNNSWTSAGARIFVYFSDKNGHDCWTSTWVNQDQYKYYYNSTDNADAYFCYPEDTSYQWTMCIFVRMPSTATKGDFTTAWNQTDDIVFANDSSKNMFGPWLGDYGSHGCNWLYNDVSAGTITAGTTVYLRDKNKWSDANAVLKLSLMENSHWCPDWTVNFTKVEGKYDDDQEVVDLWEAVVPQTGGYRKYKLWRADPSTGDEWNGTGDRTLDGYSNNVFETTAIDNGSFAWTVTDSTRVNMFSKYIVDETAGYCNAAHYNTNTKETFATVWDKFESQYNGMSGTNQTSFKNATAGEASHPGKGALRYDYLVGKYDLKDFATRGSSASSSVKILPFTSLTDNGGSFIAVIASLLVATVAIGGYFLLRKKRI